MVPLEGVGRPAGEAAWLLQSPGRSRSETGDHSAQNVDHTAGLPMEVRAQRRIGGCNSLLTSTFRLLTGRVSAGTEGTVIAAGRVMVANGHTSSLLLATPPFLVRTL